MVLVVDRRIGRVDILLTHALGAGVEQAAAEGHHLAAHGEPGEDDPACETVVELAVLTLAAQSAGRQILGLVTLGECLPGQRIAPHGGEPETETLYHIVSEAARAPILHTDGLPVGVVVQDMLVVVGGPLIDNEHALALALLLLLLAGELTFLYLDVVLACEPFQRLHIGHLLVLHDEVDGIAGLAAGEALVNAS